MEFQLAVLRGRSAAQTVKLTAAVTVVGRQQDCQLRVASSQVSRRHCQLFEQKGYLVVKDLGSANGTLVNGKKIAEQRVLEPGDELTIGPVKFRVEKAGAPPAPKAAKPGDTAVAAAQPAADAPIELGTDDILDVIIDDDETQVVAPSKEAPTKDAAAGAPGAAAHAAPEPPPEPAAKDLGEEAVAEFLMDLKVDDE